MTKTGPARPVPDSSSRGWFFRLLFDPGFAGDPRPSYTQLRDLGVARDEFETDISRPTVVVTRHEDVDRVLRDPSLFSSRFAEAMGGLGNDRPLIPLEVDPPEHKKYRVLLDPYFAPRRMADLEAQMVDLVNGLIDRFAADGRCELMSQFAVPLPGTVFLQLLGLPVEELDFFLGIKEKIVRGGGEADITKQADVRSEGGREWHGYFDSALDRLAARRQPGLLGDLLDAEADGIRLTREEIIDICYLLFLAGLDTVTASLSCFWSTLAGDEALRRRIAGDPDVIPSAVEELMRWEAPVSMVARVATADTDLGGCPVSRGDAVIVLLGSANTDPSGTPDAGRLELDRSTNRHMAFGGGIHRCLGSHLARLELRVALREWHRRIPDYRIEEGADLRWAPIPRSLHELPLRW